MVPGTVASSEAWRLKMARAMSRRSLDVEKRSRKAIASPWSAVASASRHSSTRVRSAVRESPALKSSPIAEARLSARTWIASGKVAPSGNRTEDGFDQPRAHRMNSRLPAVSPVFSMVTHIIA